MWEILEHTLSSQSMEGMLLCLRQKVEVWDFFKVTPGLYTKFGYLLMLNRYYLAFFATIK